jgi:hypothetical protein
MNKATQSRIIKAANLCGLKVRPAKSLSGDLYVGLIYNKVGDSTYFDPSSRIGDAVEMLLITGGTLKIDNEKSICVICDKEQVVVVSGSWVTAPKNKNKNICNAILNFILSKRKANETI